MAKGDGFSVDVSALKNIAKRFDSPRVRKGLADLPKARAIAALISQAISDNFDKEGPGWAPLKGKTLRLSVGKGLLKHAQRMAAYDMGALRKTKSGTSVNKKKLKGEMEEFHKRTEKYLVQGEKAARKTGAEPGRMILQRTGLLKRISTTPGAVAASKSGQRGSNTYRVEGTNLIWGVDLTYARAQNRGVPERNLPARPFLVIREEWYDKIRNYMVEQVLRIIQNSIVRGE